MQKIKMCEDGAQSNVVIGNLNKLYFKAFFLLYQLQLTDLTVKQNWRRYHIVDDRPSKNGFLALTQDFEGVLKNPSMPQFISRLDQHPEVCLLKVYSKNLNLYHCVIFFTVGFFQIK